MDKFTFTAVGENGKRIEIYVSASLGSQPPSIKLVLPYKYTAVITVSGELYENVRSLISEIIPAMDPSEKYTLEALCGVTAWKLLTDGEKRLAGKCMVFMVANKVLPLDFAPFEHEYPKHYQLG